MGVPFQVALLGHSNCGKSALLNALTGSSVKRGPAGVHARAGWTAELSFFRVFPAESQMPSAFCLSSVWS